MKIKLMVILVLAMVLLVGCSTDDLIGTWMDDSTGQTLTFNEDNSCSFGQIEVSYEVDEDTLNLLFEDGAQSMNYTIDEDVLVLSFPDLDDFELIYSRVSK